jgi:hypothetical protein
MTDKQALLSRATDRMQMEPQSNQLKPAKLAGQSKNGDRSVYGVSFLRLPTGHEQGKRDEGALGESAGKQVVTRVTTRQAALARMPSPRRTDDTQRDMAQPTERTNLETENGARYSFSRTERDCNSAKLPTNQRPGVHCLALAKQGWGYLMPDRLLVCARNSLQPKSITQVPARIIQDPCMHDQARSE